MTGFENDSADVCCPSLCLNLLIVISSSCNSLELEEREVIDTKEFFFPGLEDYLISPLLSLPY